MKKLYWVLTVAVLLPCPACRRRGQQVTAAPQVDAPSVMEWKLDPPTTIQNNPVKIFQRAFWASPASDDKILHAERREWKDSDEVQKWQWFLVVEPSPALLKRLRDDNAFALKPAASASPPAEAPAWFVFTTDKVSGITDVHCELAQVTDYEQFIQHVCEGVTSQKDLAEMMGKHKGTVSKWARKALQEGRLSGGANKLLPPKELPSGPRAKTRVHASDDDFDDDEDDES